MTTRIEFFFDYGSPYSYLADSQLPGLASRTGCEVVYRPILLGGIFKATGNRSPAQEPIAAKRAYGGVTLHRTAARYGTPFVSNPFFPVNTLNLMRTAVAAQREGAFPAFHAAVYPAFWAAGRNLGEPAVLADVVGEAGLDAGRLAELASDDGVKAELRANTDEAVDRGAFGAPTFFVDGEMYFGADHLVFLEEALSSR